MGGMSNSILAFEDCKIFLDRAMDAELGSRYPLKSENDAVYFRNRCNHFRVLHRALNREIYQKGDPMWNVSNYDQLKITVKNSDDGYWWVYAEPRAVNEAEIEDITPDDGAASLAARPSLTSLITETTDDAEDNI
jgi:hypothetical protein